MTSGPVDPTVDRNRRSIVRRLLDLIFGYDLFISYAWADGGLYAAALAERLEAEGFDVFLDRDDYTPGDDWKVVGGWTLRRTGQLILVGSPLALHSDPVLRELRIFRRTGRRIIPIDFGGSLESPPTATNLSRLITSRHIAIRESAERLAAGPSDQALAAVRRGFNLVRQDRKRLRFLAGASGVMAFLAGLAMVFGVSAELASAEAARNARRAVDQAAEAQRQTARANDARDRAVKAEGIAADAEAQALQDRDRARQSAAEAARQRNLAFAQAKEARAGRLAAEAQLVLSDPLAPGEGPIRSLLASLTLSPSPTARDAIRLGAHRLPPVSLGRLPWPDDSQPPRTLQFSPGGRWLGALTAREALFWDLKDRRLVMRRPLADPPAATTRAEEPKPDIDQSGARLLFGGGEGRALIRAAASGDGERLRVVDLTSATDAAFDPSEVFDATTSGADILVICRPDPTGGAHRPGTRLQEAIVSPTRDWGAAVIHACRSDEGGRARDAILATVAADAKISRQSLEPGFEVREARLFETLAYVSDGQAAHAVIDPAKPAPMMLALPSGAALLALKRSSPPSWPPAPPSTLDGTLLFAYRRDDGNEVVASNVRREPLWESRPDTEDFVRFVGGGGDVIEVVGRDGPGLVSLAARLALTTQAPRREDYDLAVMSQLRSYSPMVSLKTAEDGDAIAVAWRDGRVSELIEADAPRYGTGSAALPMPGFQTIAQFDHGQELATSIGWRALPALFISPSGRFLASYSIGAKTTPTGGFASVNPILRIWDRDHQAEAARLRPGILQTVAFSADDKLMATFATPLSAPDGKPRPGELALARLPASLSLAADRLLDQFPLPPLLSAAERFMTSPPAGAPNTWSDLGGAPIWLSWDAKLLYKPTGRPVRELDDLRPFLPARAMPAGLADDDPETSDRRPALVPAAAVSADGRYAVVGFGPQLGLYDLRGGGRLVRRVNLGRGRDSRLAYAYAVAIASDGRAFSATVVSPPNSSRHDSESAKAELLVFRRGADKPSHRRPIAIQTPDGVTLPDAPLAVSADGRWVALSRLQRTGGAPAVGLFVATVIVDLATGHESIRLPATPLDPADLVGLRGGEPPLVAFNTEAPEMLALNETPDCPSVVRTNAALMPTAVPVCRRRRIEVSLWDLAHGTPQATSVLYRESFDPPGSVPIPSLSPRWAAFISRAPRMTIGFSGRNMSLELSQGRLAVEDDGVRLELQRVAYRADLATGVFDVSDACARLKAAAPSSGVDDALLCARALAAPPAAPRRPTQRQPGYSSERRSNP